MPLTRRQFELGIDDELETTMRGIYNLLHGHRNLAYSIDELEIEFIGQPREDVSGGPVINVVAVRKLSRALRLLVELGAVAKRTVDVTDYYAFLRRFDTRTWEEDLSDVRV